MCAQGIELWDLKTRYTLCMCLTDRGISQSIHRFCKLSVSAFIEALGCVAIVVDFFKEDVLDVPDGEVKLLMLKRPLHRPQSSPHPVPVHPQQQ